MDGQVVLGGVAWLLTLLFFAGQAVTQTAVTPYSLAANNISDLGSTTCGPIAAGAHHTTICSPLYTVMNATFITIGLLTGAGER